MLWPIVFCLFVVTTANPFHKYPYVFLLDIGNEELEKANTEQIRITVPGGSIALRYPAVGDGDTIAHVRVSGIDFGTDLKANIVDGGPGYKYVILVFMGNPGVTYDAVLTIQTVPTEAGPSLNPPYVNYNINSQNGDPNDSSEDLSDDSSSGFSQDVIPKNNAEFTQSSSNVYRYAQNEQVYSEDNHKYEENDNVKDDDGPGDSDYEVNNDKADVDDNNDDDGGDDDNNDDDDDGDDDKDENDEGNNEHSDQDEESNGSKPQEFSNNNDYDDDKESLRDRDEPNDKFQNEDDPAYNEVDEENPEIRRLFSNSIHNDKDKHKDFNNNDYIDSEDSFAVAY